MPVDAISPGTIRKPPPMPKKPDTMPVPKPQRSTRGALSRLHSAPGLPIAPRLRSISTPTASITNAKRPSRYCPSRRLPKDEPASAPATPAASVHA